MLFDESRTMHAVRMKGSLRTMFTPSPGLWPGLIEARQHRMRGAGRDDRTAGPGIRVRIGHLLIATGSMLSGDRVELARHRPIASRSA
jgi:hypothetical protein